MDPVYQNPKIPEGINSKPSHPLREFLSLVFVVGVVFASAVLVLTLLASQIAVRIPFQYERDLVERFEFIQPNASNPQQVWLENLVDDLVLAADLPEDMEITVHYVDDDLVNAMATLGGHIFVFRGLIEALPSENALAMVIAHEIAHVQHRHPMLALGRVATVAIAVAAFSGISGTSLSGLLLDHVQLMTQLKFSRNQEREADHSGLNTIINYYGHASDADALFRHIARHNGGANGDREDSRISIPEIFQTHPDPESRARQIQQIIKQRGLETRPTRPVPDIFINPDSGSR